MAGSSVPTILLLFHKAVGVLVATDWQIILTSENYFLRTSVPAVNLGFATPMFIVAE